MKLNLGQLIHRLTLLQNVHGHETPVECLGEDLRCYPVSYPFVGDNEQNETVVVIHCKGNELNTEPDTGGETVSDYESKMGRDTFLAFRRAIMRADRAFQDAGAAGTKTWLRDFVFPELETERLILKLEDVNHDHQ